MGHYQQRNHWQHSVAVLAMRTGASICFYLAAHGAAVTSGISLLSIAGPWCLARWRAPSVNEGDGCDHCEEARANCLHARLLP